MQMYGIVSALSATDLASTMSRLIKPQPFKRQTAAAVMPTAEFALIWLSLFPTHTHTPTHTPTHSHTHTPTHSHAHTCSLARSLGNLFYRLHPGPGPCCPIAAKAIKFRINYVLNQTPPSAAASSRAMCGGGQESSQGVAGRGAGKGGSFCCKIVNCQLGHVAWDYATMSEWVSERASEGQNDAQSVGHAGQGRSGNNSLVFPFCSRCRKSFLRLMFPMM